MDILRRNVRYGTAIMPFYRKNVLAELPGYAFTNSDVNPFADYVLFPNARCVPSETSRLNLPSVTFVNGCVHDQAALYAWQCAMIKQMGSSKFKEYSLERMNIGTKVHRAVENILNDFVAKGKIEKSDDEIVESLIHEKKSFEDSMRGYVKSILPFLRANLVSSDRPILTEEKVTHHGLFYGGKFDAICSLGGEDLMLVDWKTVSSASTKSDTGADEAELYSYPTQLAAYVGAVNADPNFSSLGPIKKAAVVLMYESQRPAEMRTFEAEELQAHWDKWLCGLYKYYWTMKNVSGDPVPFVYNPHAPGRVFGIRN